MRTLFLIRYVDEIRGNVDNLVTLFVDRIDADRLALRQNIEASLLRLERETLIGRNGEDFFFLTNEERDISREIKDVDLSSAEEAKFLGELIFEDLLKGQRKQRFPDNNKDFGINRLCDLHPHGTRTDGDLVLSVVTPLADDYALYDEGRCILQSAAEGGQLIVRLDEDKTLGRELRTYLQTDRYIGRKNDGTAATTTVKILREREAENRERRARLVLQLERLCKEATCYAAGQPVRPKGGTAATVLTEALNYLIRNSFNKLGYLSHLSANPQAEIKAVLSSTDVDDLGFSLAAGQGNQQALAEVEGHVNLMAGANRQVILQDLVDERFGRRPFGWPEWEVILLVARLVRKGAISLVMDGATLSTDKVFEAVVTPSKWRRITVIKRQTVDQGQLQAARHLAKEVFGQIAPDGEDALAACLREHLGGWRTSLAQYKTLADTGDYPGRQELAEAAGIIAKLLAQTESFGLIGTFLERKADLLELSDQVHELTNFYETQRPTWERLRKAFDRFQPNRTWLDKDPTAAAALARMQVILTAAAPYGLIKDAEALIQTVEGVDTALVAERRAQVLQAIDAQLAKVQVELDDAKASADLRNRCLLPLQTLKRQVETQTSMAHIDQAGQAAVDAADEAFAKIEAAANQKNATDTVGDKVEQVYVKPRRIVKVSALAPAGYLETQSDVDGYLDRLRKALEKAISAGERVEIR